MSLLIGDQEMDKKFGAVELLLTCDIVTMNQRLQKFLTMKNVPRWNRWSHHAANMGGEERQGLPGATVQTPTARSGEDYREDIGGHFKRAQIKS